MKTSVALLAIVLGAVAAAQDRPADTAPKVVTADPRLASIAADSPYSRFFNPSSVIVFDGRVAGITISNRGSGTPSVVDLLVKTPNGGTALVDLGAEWFVDNQTVRLRVRDLVRVTGSKVTVRGKSIILATTIRANGQTFVFRGDTGLPVWYAWRSQEEFQREVAADDLEHVTGNVSAIGFVDENDPNSNRALVLTTDSGLAKVDLGPQWFYNQQQFNFPVGTSVVFLTRRFQSGVIIVPATGLIHENRFMVLRDASGRPIWSATWP